MNLSDLTGSFSSRPSDYPGQDETLAWTTRTRSTFNVSTNSTLACTIVEARPLKKFQCGVCGKVSKDRQALMKHGYSHVKVECSICNKTYSKATISVHMKFHVVENLFECDLCKFSSKIKRCVKDHIERMHLPLDTSKQSKCGVCGKVYKNRQFLKQHGYSHVKVECSFCNKMIFKTSISGHIKRMHMPLDTSQKFQCGVCGKVSKDRQALTKQGYTHVKVEGSICNKTYSKVTILTHLKAHVVEKLFECDLCKFSSKNKWNLKDHIERMHLPLDTSKQSKCGVCGKVCNDRQALMKHGYIHNKAKCSICNKMFSKDNMLRHMKRMHSAEKIVDSDETFKRPAVPPLKRKLRPKF